MPVAPYLKMDCKELATEMSSLTKEAESARSQVDSAYSSDKTKEAVAWILFAPAALLMDGNQQETGKLAALKGQIEAVQEAQKINKCSLWHSQLSIKLPFKAGHSFSTLGDSHTVYSDA